MVATAAVASSTCAGVSSIQTAHGSEAACRSQGTGRAKMMFNEWTRKGPIPVGNEFGMLPFARAKEHMQL